MYCINTNLHVYHTYSSFIEQPTTDTGSKELRPFERCHPTQPQDLYVYIYIYTYVYIYVYTYIHTYIIIYIYKTRKNEHLLCAPVDMTGLPASLLLCG